MQPLNLKSSPLNEDADAYLKRVQAICTKNRISFEDFKEIGDLITKNITAQLEEQEMYLPCDDKSGEIYNRRTGQRYKISNSGKPVVEKKHIGQFTY